MDNELREPHAYNERINSPYDVYNQWKYRMPVTLEQLAKAGKYNHKLRTMTTHSKRG